MACMLLGVEDEPVVPDALMDFKVNKAGGKPVILTFKMHYKKNLETFFTITGLVCHTI